VPARPSLAGYGDPYRFEYPGLWLQVGATALAIVCLVGYSWLAATLRNGEFAITFGPAGLVVLLGTFVGTVLVHEAIHGAVARLLGYEVSYGIAWSMAAAYAASFEQPITRRDNAIVAVAPLVVLTPIGVALVPVVDGLVLLVVFFVLVLNTASAAGDLYLLARLARMPPGTVLYDVSVDEMLVYEPAGPSGES